MPQRNTKYIGPGIVFTILGLLHAALLVSFVHGTVTTTITTTVTARTITIGTLPWTPGPTPPSQTISFQNPTNPSETFLFECPAGCNGGAACEWVSPVNCSEYVNCDYRREPALFACDEGLHFWDQLKQCAPPRQAKCTPMLVENGIRLCEMVVHHGLSGGSFDLVMVLLVDEKKHNYVHSRESCVSFWFEDGIKIDLSVFLGYDSIAALASASESFLMDYAYGELSGHEVALGG
ncbi:hypothetical protein NA56DRAFT_702198 [Hyaloscypha hepaticicola]|uniref:Chitin-binding type-2 domain-containing protein n=1 Tax=Hyaloscypha hepaticicola TaxID=2082293 RepID=A0A2J6QA00_9HELO|nr:hypothetical protein NA56DRAFT_702198 [Hyaloscypha hepaticicola]